MKESPPGATAATRKASDRLSLEAAERDVTSGMSPTSPMASPKADGGADAEAPAAKKARATPEKAPRRRRRSRPRRRRRRPRRRRRRPRRRRRRPRRRRRRPRRRRRRPRRRRRRPRRRRRRPRSVPPARARAESPASPASGPARSPLSANAASRSPRPSPRAVAKPAARAVAAAERLAADQDPLATLVLGGGGGGPGSARDSFRTPGAGFKKAGASKTVGAAGKQTSLLGLGFFSKTPAGAGARPPRGRPPREASEATNASCSYEGTGTYYPTTRRDF